MAGTAELKARLPYTVLVRGTWRRGRVDERSVCYACTPSLTGPLDRRRALQTSRSLAMSQAASAASPTSTSNWQIHVCRGRPRGRFHSGLASGRWPARVLTARRSASCAGTDPRRRRTWPNTEIRLFWILLQMLCCWVWLITDAFGTKSVRAEPCDWIFVCGVKHLKPTREFRQWTFVDNMRRCLLAATDTEWVVSYAPYMQRSSTDTVTSTISVEYRPSPVALLEIEPWLAGGWIKGWVVHTYLYNTWQVWQYIKCRAKKAVKHFRHFTDTLKFAVKINCGKDGKNKWDFSLVLKVCREFDGVTSAGKLFHVGAAATRNTQLPTVDSRVGGTSNTEVDDDRRRWLVEGRQPGRPVLVHGRIIDNVYTDSQTPVCWCKCLLWLVSLYS